MKIALFIDYGPNKFSKELKAEMEKCPFPQCRAKIVKFIEQNGKFIDKHRNVYELANSFYSIEDVNTARPWTIAEYDGSEYIQYLDYEVIDKKINYCTLKNK